MWAYEMPHIGKPLLQDMWGPEKGRTDIVEGVGFEVAVPARVRLL